jgi:hypothetical protein
VVLEISVELREKKLKSLILLFFIFGARIFLVLTHSTTEIHLQPLLVLLLSSEAEEKLEAVQATQ